MAKALARLTDLCSRLLLIRFHFRPFDVVSRDSFHPANQTSSRNDLESSFSPPCQYSIKGQQSEGGGGLFYLHEQIGPNHPHLRCAIQRGSTWRSRSVLERPGASLVV